MPTTLLLIRPHLKVVRGLSCASQRSNVRQNPQRQQSSSSSPPNPKATPESEAQAQVKAHSEPQIRQQGKVDDPIPVPSVVPPLPFWQRLGPLTRAGEAYARAQRARPWATQVASAMVVYLCADFGAQWMSSGCQDQIDDGVEGKENSVGEDNGAEKKGRKHDWARTARSLAIGGSAAIPGYIWFTFLSRSFNYSSRVLSIGIKVTVNQVLFTPLFNVYFFGAQALLSGDNLAEAWRRVANTVPVSWVNSCKLWPAVTAFNFAFVPFEYRSIFGGVIAVGWQTYLSFLNSRAEKLEALRQKEHAAFDGAGQQLRAVPLDENLAVAAVRGLQELPGKQAIMD
ncbi:hypothetical protein GQX73_g2450 [Xylaria multiplex]|uniref:Mpv17/PMP22 family protein n=1 Tax=Xylaria multiplex TaxID=323545 RepID=A0A7C8ISC1_9PEZI|nr:hypothetical protein GQX73_g2450 [Xylaria multiplex]